MTESFIYKNSTTNEINDVRNPRVFQFEGYGYRIVIKPKCKFWRVGLRFSLENKSQSFSTTHRQYNSPHLKHVELCAGTRENGAWQNSNVIQLQQYNIEGAASTLFSSPAYRENTEIIIDVYPRSLEAVQFTLSGAINFSTNLDLRFSKSFEIWAWADFTDFEIDTHITKNLIPINLPLNTNNNPNPNPILGQVKFIEISNIAVFFGSNNCGKTSILVGLCNAYHNKFLFSMDYIGLNRFYTDSIYDIKLESLHLMEKVSEQERNRKERVRMSLGQNLLFDWMKELALQDEDTRTRILDWIKVNFDAWDFEEQKTGKYVTNIQAKVNQGDPLEQGSGARAVLPIIIQLFNPQVEFLAIDEPELGLEPRMQKIVFRAIKNASEGKNGFPLKRVLLATHSHLFLDKVELSNNFSVNKMNNVVQIEKIIEERELQKATYDLLGSAPSDLFFPGNIVIVEGISDQIFLKAIYKLGKKLNEFSSDNIVFHYLEGFSKTPTGVEAVVQMLKTQSYVPVYKDKICGLFDKPLKDGKLINEVREFVGDTSGKRFILLDQTAIEFYYPLSIINNLFKRKCSKDDYSIEITQFLSSVSTKSSRKGKIFESEISKGELAHLVAEHLTIENFSEIDSKIIELLLVADKLAYM